MKNISYMNIFVCVCRGTDIDIDVKGPCPFVYCLSANGSWNLRAFSPKTPRILMPLGPVSHTGFASFFGAWKKGAPGVLFVALAPVALKVQIGHTQLRVGLRVGCA